MEQDVVRVSHRDTVEDMSGKGRDLEKVVLSRAVRWHLENRVLVYQNKTVVFVYKLNKAATIEKFDGSNRISS